MTAVLRKHDVCAQEGDRARCRYCSKMLRLKPWKKLTDGTQVYWWVGSLSERQCHGRGANIGAPEHRPHDGERKVS